MRRRQKEERVVFYQKNSWEFDNPIFMKNNDQIVLKADNINSARSLLRLSELKQQKTVEVFFDLGSKCSYLWKQNMKRSDIKNDPIGLC